MEKYGNHTEKTYRQAFCTVIDWFYANQSLLMQVSGPTDRLAIAIDPAISASLANTHLGQVCFGLDATAVQNGASRYLESLP